ncbi:MAG: hypothetical protein IJJ26_13055 [Victivallales bacterium]|nr:hypothetical protein [Victivallales bacterium]
MLEQGTLVLGANYWASHAATEMWRNWRPDVIRQDFQILAAHHLTLLRVFPIWRDFQPIVELHRAGGDGYAKPKETRFAYSEAHLPDTPAGYAGVDETMMARFREFCDIADEFDIHLIVCVMTAHMTFRLFLPPAMEGRDLYGDPYALKWEGRYIDFFVRTMKDHPAIAFWESGNESDCLGDIGSKERAEVWLRFIHSTIRLADPMRPVIGISGLNLYDDDVKWPSCVNAEQSDYVTVHPYNMWSKASLEEFNGIRNMLFATAQCTALEQITRRAAFCEEHGCWRPDGTSYQNLARYQRGLLWNLWANGCRGMLWWCAFDQDLFDIAPYDWKEPGLEHGLFTAERLPHPGAKTIATFATFLASQKRPLPSPTPDTIFLTADEDVLHSSYILAREAGILPRFQAPEDPIRDADCYFMPSCFRRNHLSTRRWEALQARVREGATLYLAWDHTYLTHLDEVCGATLLSSTEGRGTMTYSFPGFQLTLPEPRHNIFQSLGAEVLATDSDGNPVLFRNHYGKGSVYTLGFSLEAICYNKAGLFQTNAWKIYRLIRPVPQPVSANSPFINATTHRFHAHECAVILVNNGLSSFDGTITVADGYTILSAETDAPDAARLEGTRLFLENGAGILLHVSH